MIRVKIMIFIIHLCSCS